jgi:hypothetical protein
MSLSHSLLKTRVDEFKPFTPEDKGGFKTILLVRVRWVSEPVVSE